MNKIRIAIVGVGNCASSLLQGINFYRDSSGNGADVGLMHRQIGPYQPQDIRLRHYFDYFISRYKPWFGEETIAEVCGGV